jgi:DNA-binding HxlR family transcriptional regulator
MMSCMTKLADRNRLSCFMQLATLAGVKRTSFAGMDCSLAQCLEVVGEWWTLLVLRDAMLGVTRFEDFADRLGIARNVLTSRLDGLVEHGVLARVPYSEHPVRYDYRVTEKGRDLWPVLTAMRQWGDRWAAPDGPPIELRHTGCGEIATVVPTCSHCRAALDARSVTVVPGPGLGNVAIPVRRDRIQAG